MTSSASSPPDLVSALGAPPVLPSLESELDAYLLRPDLLPVHNRDRLHFWARTPKPQRLLHAEMAPVDSTLEVERDQATGTYTGERVEI